MMTFLWFRLDFRSSDLGIFCVDRLRKHLVGLPIYFTSRSTMIS